MPSSSTVAITCFCRTSRTPCTSTRTPNTRRWSPPGVRWPSSAPAPRMIRLAVLVTSVLNVCGLGVLASGIVEVARRRGPLTRLAALAMAGVLCLIGFGLAGAFAFADYADLLWAAAAVGALVFGLVLPRAPHHLAVAWLCATAASLTKNEGLTTSLMIFVLLSIRYLPARHVAVTIRCLDDRQSVGLR